MIIVFGASGPSAEVLLLNGAPRSLKLAIRLWGHGIALLEPIRAHSHTYHDFYLQEDGYVTGSQQHKHS